MDEGLKRVIEEKVKSFFSTVPPPAFVNPGEYIASLKNLLESRLGFEITSLDMDVTLARWGEEVEIKFEFKTREGRASSCVVKMPARDMVMRTWWSKEPGKASSIIALKWDPERIAVNCWV